MTPTDAYRTIAEKCLHTAKYPELAVPDSLIRVLRHMYTEEESELVAAIARGARTAGAIARRVHRPVSDIKPLLDSLSKRLLILGVGARGFSTYALLPLYPLLYDAQLLICEKKMREEGEDGAWHAEFVRRFKEFLNEFYDWLTPRDIASRYQILGIPFGRIIPVEQAIHATPGLGVMAFPTDRYSELVERAKKSLCLVSVCTCRHGRALIGEGCGRERNTCSTMGLPAEGAIKAGMGRRVSREEFLEAKAIATRAGLVHMTENVQDPMLVCSCCNCCCEVMGILKKFSHPAALVQNRFAAAVDPGRCTGCKACMKRCPMDAISMVERKPAGAGKPDAARRAPPVRQAAAKKPPGKKGAGKRALVDPTRCIGCGVCVVQCDKYRAMTLQERKVYTPPADNMVEFWLRHYFQQRGRQDNALPRLSLGITRLLSSVNPVHVTGPRAMSFQLMGGRRPGGGP